MTTNQKSEILNKIETATKLAILGQRENANPNYKYGYLNGLKVAAEVLGVPADEIDAAFQRGVKAEAEA